MSDGQRRGTMSLIRQQFRYHNKIFWRTPAAAFFSLIFPVLLFVIFSLVFGNQRIEELGVTTAQYYAPALAVFATASAAYSSLAISTAYQRDFGILKRVQGAPVPGWVYMVGKVASAVVVSAIATVVMIGIGVLFYGLDVKLITLPAAILTFLIGTGTFAAMGFLVAALTSSGDTATAVAQATLLPLAFFSGNFFVATQMPAWMVSVADIFPLKHFNDAFSAAFDPLVTGAGFEWGHLLVIVIWGAASGYLAIRHFRWEPGH